MHCRLDCQLTFIFSRLLQNAITLQLYSRQVFLQIFVDDVARAGGITTRTTATADDESMPSPVTMETEPSVIDTQFTSPQAPASSQSLTASPGHPRNSSQSSGTTSSTAMPTAPSPFSSMNVNSPGSFYAPSPGKNHS